MYTFSLLETIIEITKLDVFDYDSSEVLLELSVLDQCSEIIQAIMTNAIAT